MKRLNSISSIEAFLAALIGVCAATAQAQLPGPDAPRDKITSILRQRLETGSGVSGSGAKILQSNTQGSPYCYLYLNATPPSFRQKLEKVGVRVTHFQPGYAAAQAYVPWDLMDSLCQWPEVRRIAPVLPPVLSSGSVCSSGDTIHNFLAVREKLKLDGTGVKIGVISDGVDGLTQSKASGDLPAQVQVLDAGQGGEGIAILEILHDLAPGASLAFCTGINGMLAFNTAIDRLFHAGARVIVDDVGYTEEPAFEDGVIALHVQSIVEDSGVVFVTAAGNNAESHYEADYQDVNPSSTTLNQHDFGNGDTTLTVGLRPNIRMGVVLHWNDKCGASANDYNLYLYRSAMATRLAYSVDRQSGRGDPIEHMIYANGPDSQTVDIVIRKLSGLGRHLEIYINFDQVTPYIEYNVDTSSIFGHKAADAALTVGAINTEIAGYDVVEPFSSRGNVRIDFPAFAMRAKPDVCGADRVYVTGAGGFTTYFAGTSAAAPHVGAVAAVILQARPEYVPAQVKSLISRTAVEIEGAGRDQKSGWGRVDAFAALSELVNNPPVVADIPGQTIFPGDTFVNLSAYAGDSDDSLSSLVWHVSGTENLGVNMLESDLVRIVAPSGWSGQETLWFVAQDPAGASDSSYALFTILADRPCFLTADSILAQTGSDFGLKLDYYNPLGGQAGISPLGPIPNWLHMAGDTLWGSPPLAGIDTLRLVLDIGGTPYDTLYLRITITDPVRVLNLGRIPSALGISVLGPRIRFRIHPAGLGPILLKIFAVSGGQVWGCRQSPSLPASPIEVVPPSLGPGVYVAVLLQNGRSCAVRFVQAQPRWPHR